MRAVMPQHLATTNAAGRTRDHVAPPFCIICTIPETMTVSRKCQQTHLTNKRLSGILFLGVNWTITIHLYPG